MEEMVGDRKIEFDHNARRWRWEDTGEFMDPAEEAAHFAGDEQPAEEPEQPARRGRGS